MAVSDYVPPVTQLIHENSELRTQLHQAQETLRDRFAMAALTGLLACDFVAKKVAAMDVSVNPTFAGMAYEFADAMMEQRDISRTCGKSD